MGLPPPLKSLVLLRVPGPLCWDEKQEGKVSPSSQTSERKDEDA